MRLRRRRTRVSTGRRQRQPAEPGARGSAPFAYRARRSEEELNVGRQQPHEASRRAPKDWGTFLLKRSGLIILLIALFISAINMLSVSGSAKVMPLTGSSDTFLHDKSVYESAADKLLADSVWNRNKITINTSDVSQGMLKQFPELSSVSVTLPLFNKRPIVYIQTTQPALILAAQNGTFVVGTNGKALLPADQLPANNTLSLPTVTDQSGLQAQTNHQALSSTDVAFILTVAGQLSARHQSVESMTLPVRTSELDIKLAGQPYTVKFNLESGDARQQTGTLLATQAKLQSQNITPSEYIDVRLDGRAYYK
jgi:hypothetical protein